MTAGVYQLWLIISLKTELGLLVFDNVNNGNNYHCLLRTNFFLSSNLLFKVFLRSFFFSLLYTHLAVFFLWRIGSIIMLLSRVQSLLICRQKIVLYNQIWVPAICLIFTENKSLFLFYFHILVLIVLMEMKKEIQQSYQKRWKKIQRSKERHKL